MLARCPAAATARCPRRSQRRQRAPGVAQRRVKRSHGWNASWLVPLDQVDGNSGRRLRMTGRSGSHPRSRRARAAYRGGHGRRCAPARSGPFFGGRGHDRTTRARNIGVVAHLPSGSWTASILFADRRFGDQTIVEYPPPPSPRYPRGTVFAIRHTRRIMPTDVDENVVGAALKHTNVIMTGRRHPMRAIFASGGTSSTHSPDIGRRTFGLSLAVGAALSLVPGLVRSAAGHGAKNVVPFTASSPMVPAGAK